MAGIGSEGAAGAARSLVFVLVLAAIVVGPGHLRWLVAPRSTLDGWSMYHDLGVGLVDARFVQVTADGARLELDPLKLLRSEPRPISRRLRGLGEFEALGLKLCAALGPGSEVRAHARVATLEGWTVAATGDVNMCAARPAGVR